MAKLVSNTNAVFYDCFQIGVEDGEMVESDIEGTKVTEQN